MTTLPPLAARFVFVDGRCLGAALSHLHTITWHLCSISASEALELCKLWRWSPLQAWWAQLVAAHQFSSWERRWTLTSQYPAASILLSKVFFLTCHSHRLHWQSERHICKLGTAALGVRKGGDTSIPSGDPACGKKSIFYPSHLDIRFFNLTEEAWGLFILVRKVTWLFNFPWFFLQLSITALLTLFSARTYNKFFFQVREVSDQRKDALPELDALSDSI